MNPELEWKIKNLPDSPGCYMMKSKGEIIYVGKAKNLKNRVRQYFQSSSGHTPKVRAMVERVDDFDIVLVDGELEAFILECNLIKRHMPFYNILLKDDKHYPFLRVDMREEFPAVTLVREQKKDGARYFGPYIGATVVREVLDIARMLFPIRHCETKLRAGGSARPCLHHQIGMCMAPCAGLVTSEEYHAVIKKLAHFLSGHYDDVLAELKARMSEAAAELNFERAATYRDRIRAVNDIMQKQKAIITGGGDHDVLACLPCLGDAIAQLMQIRGGRLISSENFTLEHAADDDAGEVLTRFMTQYYSSASPPAPEIFVSAMPAEADTLCAILTDIIKRRVHIIQPKRGDNAQLVAMAKKNIIDEAHKREKKRVKSHAHTQGALEELARALNLPCPPKRIEGYDISNTQGVLSVGSEVVMVDGAPAKREYRLYRIKTVEGANDFESMREVLTRRLSHGLRERAELEAEGKDASEGKFSSLPDLILIDGGRGQLNAALEAMRAQGLDIPMFGLAKRVEEIVLPGEDESVLLDRHSEALHLIQRLRDEAHRFAITRHRSLRASKSVSSRLDGIPGVGPKRKRALLGHFKTIEALLEADIQTLSQVEGLGPARAEAIYNALHAKESK